MTSELDVQRVLPMPRRVVVRLHKRSERTHGGLYVPGGEQVVQTIGTVVEPDPPAVDEAGRLTESMLRAGDVIVFGKFNGMEVKIGNDTLVVVPVAEVACRLVVADTSAEPSAQEQ